MVLPFDWHSFCISINVGLKEATVFHNGHIQAIQPFKKLEYGTEESSRFMTTGNLERAKFVGTVIDFEVFGGPLPDRELLDWRLCQNEEPTSFSESNDFNFGHKRNNTERYKMFLLI